MQHIPETVFERYAADQASEDEQLRVDAHLADCPDCRERMRSIIYLFENFESLWNSWTAAEHGRIYRRWRLAKAIADRAEDSPDLSERAWQRLKQAKSGMAVAVRIIMDKAGRVATAASDRLPPGYTFDLQPAYAGVGSHSELARLQSQLKKGSDLLGQGDAQQAVGALLEAARIDARSPQSVETEIHQGDRLIMHMTADSRRGRVWVRFYPAPNESGPDMAFLLPASADAKALLSGFRAADGEAAFVAEFTDVTKGLYTLWVLLSPAESK